MLIMGLQHMASREDPALMMDPTNCSQVQVAGTCQKPPPSHCPSGWQLYAVTQRPKGQKPYTCSRAGLLIWLLACPPLSSRDVKVRIRRPALTLPGAQQPLPEVHASRCSAPAWRGDKWHIDAYHAVLRPLARVSPWSSGQVRRSPR